jgi:hypothetical protein
MSKQDKGSQGQRFIDKARELSCDESEDALDAALRKLGKAKVKEPEGKPSRE